MFLFAYFSIKAEASFCNMFYELHVRTVTMKISFDKIKISCIVNDFS